MASKEQVSVKVMGAVTIAVILYPSKSLFKGEDNSMIFSDKVLGKFRACT